MTACAMLITVSALLFTCVKTTSQLDPIGGFACEHLPLPQLLTGFWKGPIFHGPSLAHMTLPALDDGITHRPSAGSVESSFWLTSPKPNN